MLLATNVPSAISATVCNITPKSVERLTSTYAQDVKSVVHFPTMKSLTDNLDTPTMRTLEAWWTIIHKFIHDFVNVYYSEDDDVFNDIEIRTFLELIRAESVSLNELVNSLAMMYFNNVIHELYSNDQHTHDVMQTKHIWVCHKHSQMPSYHLQERLADLLIGTSGKSVGFEEALVLTDMKDPNVISIINDFYSNINNLASDIEKDDVDYVRYLHPNSIESSITW